MKKTLLLTNSEHGQANVFLAASHSLLGLDKDVEVHFASFAPISKSVASTSDYAHPLSCSRRSVWCVLSTTEARTPSTRPRSMYLRQDLTEIIDG